MYIEFIHKTKKRASKEVFRHLNRKLLNACIDHLLHSFLLLIEICGSLLG